MFKMFTELYAMMVNILSFITSVEQRVAELENSNK
jgi:type III secretion system FlhB-like substrate exporter